jgi:hypothetical protein
MGIEFLFGVGDGLGTVIVEVLVTLIRSWNSGYLRHYLDGCEQETEDCEDEQDRFEDLVERIDSMEERVESIEERVEDTETES